MKLSSVVGVAIAGLLMGCTAVKPRGTAACALEPCNDTAPVEIKLTVNEASASAGVSTTVRIENVSPAPYTLEVCPAMKLCCVKGLHVMLGSEITAMSLMDGCAGKNPERHAVFLPSGAAFEFDMSIPAASLPEGAAAKGEELAVQLCLELADDNSLCSDAVLKTLK
jgi:hypothetical protein